MPGSPRKRAKREAAAAAAGEIAPEEIRSNLPALIPPPPEPRNRFGRPTKFRQAYVEEARILCEEGATNAELAAHFEVDESTFHYWRHTHPEFNRVILAGRGPADDRMERSLYEVGTGFSYTVEEPMKLKDRYGNERIEYVQRTIVVPPNPQAAARWLSSRRPDQWRERTEKHVTGGVEIELIPVEVARERLKARLEQLSGPKD